MRSEWDDRLNRKVERLTKAAKFRYNAVIQELDYDVRRNIDRNRVQRFAECDFIKNKESILITGSAGVGKSYLASVLGYQAG